jgi:hypothetical protein
MAICLDKSATCTQYRSSTKTNSWKSLSDSHRHPVSSRLVAEEFFCVLFWCSEAANYRSGETFWQLIATAPGSFVSPVPSWVMNSFDLVAVPKTLIKQPFRVAAQKVRKELFRHRF